VPYLSASAVVIHYEEALYQVYAPLLLPLLAFLLLGDTLKRGTIAVSSRCLSVCPSHAVYYNKTAKDIVILFPLSDSPIIV